MKMASTGAKGKALGISERMLRHVMMDGVNHTTVSLQVALRANTFTRLCSATNSTLGRT